MENPLSAIDGEGIERLHGDLYKTMQKCQRTFADVPGNYMIATTIKNDIDEFRPYIPLIVALKTPGMKDRHWDQVVKQTGIYLYILLLCYIYCIGIYCVLCYIYVYSVLKVVDKCKKSFKVKSDSCFNTYVLTEVSLICERLQRQSEALKTKSTEKLSLLTLTNLG